MLFKLNKIPDLSLNKYQSLEENGVDGVINKHNALLRQINRKGLLSKATFHLFYDYDPKRVKGEKLAVYLMAKGKNYDSLSYVQEMIQTSSLSAFYELICIQRGEFLEFTEDARQNVYGLFIGEDGREYRFLIDPKLKMSDDESTQILHKEMFISVYDDKIINIEYPEESSEATFFSKDNTYKNMAALAKKEFYIRPSTILPEDGDLKYYHVSEWEVNDKARLYTMFKLMQGMNVRVCYRVDLFAVDYSERLRRMFPIQALRERTSMKANKIGGGISVPRDENAEDALRKYNDIINDYDTSPHFRANIIALSDAPDAIGMIIDSAGAEALASGTYSISTDSANDLGARFTPMYGTDAPLNLAGDEAPKALRFLPNLYTLEEISPFFMLPALYDGEAIEIAKETAPSYNSDGMELGRDENGFTVTFPVDLFKKHAFVAGVPGAGKTNTMLHLTSTLWKKYNVPFLVFEPAKQEYRVLATTEGMEELLIFSPSSGTKFPLHINPFEFPMNMSLAEHIRNVVSVFEGAFPLEPPMPFLLDFSIEAIYRDKGWTPEMLNCGKLEYPTMSELYERLEKELETTDYNDEIKGNLKSALQVRIGSLLRRDMGDVFDVPFSSLKPEEWLKIPAVIELEAMGKGPANFMSLMLSTLIRECLKLKTELDSSEKKPLRHVIFYEEAHNLIGPESEETSGTDADPKKAATAFVVKMLAEVRALNEGIVIADQLPTVMAPEVIKNTGLKMGHRITASDDRGLLGSTMSANEMQLEMLSSFLPGEALVTYEGLLRPFKMQIKQWENGEYSYDSPSNMDLYKIMIQNPPFRSMCAKSTHICAKKYLLKTNELEKRYIKTINEFKETIKLKSFLESILKENKINTDSLDRIDDDVLIFNPILNIKKKARLYKDLKEDIENDFADFKNDMFEIKSEVMDLLMVIYACIESHEVDSIKLTVVQGKLKTLLRLFDLHKEYTGISDVLHEYEERIALWRVD